MLKLSRWFIVLVLLLGVAFSPRPVHALTISITAVDWTTTTSALGAPPLFNRISVTTDGPAQVTLSLYGNGYGYGSSEYFSPNPLVFSAAGSLDSTLTIPLPSPNDYCPGVSTSGPTFMQFTVQGRDPTVGAIGGPTLTINLLPIVSGLSVYVQASKASYMRGETVNITMDSNMPGTAYNLKINEPDGSLWATTNGYLPAFPQTVTFTKPAGDPLGTYTAILTGYFCGTAQDVTTFAITPNTYDVTVSLFGLPPDATTALLVDGNNATVMKGGDVRVLSYPIGSSHTFQVDQYVNGSAGYRYYCASNSWTAYAAGSNVFNYATQVYLDVSTDPTGITDVTASGWYAKDASASIASVPSEVQGTTGTKYVYTTWTVDDTPRGGNGFVVTMDAPHKVVAKYDTMFLLTIVSDYGNPRGAGYYKLGETAVFGVDSPVGLGIQHVFVQWSGDYTGNEPQGSITMDGPKTVTAVWTTSYFQLYLIIGAIVAIAVVAGLLVWMRRRGGGPPAMKAVPPPPPPVTEVHETVAGPVSPPLPETGTVTKPPVSIALRCTNCGHELKQGQIYCPECGQKQID